MKTQIAIGDIPKVSSWRRLLHPRKWFVALLLIICAWPCWRELAYLAAVSEVKASATWTASGPFDIISRVAYGKRSSRDEFRGLVLFKGRQLRSIAHLLPRLRPTKLEAEECMDVDLDALKGITTLRDILLYSCPALRNVDALKGHTGLQNLTLGKIPSLQNVDAIKGLTSLQWLYIGACSSLQNVDALTGLTRLRSLTLMDCRALQNVDALKGLTGLQYLSLRDCSALQNVDGIKGLSGLHTLNVIGCTGLSQSTLRDIRAALPDASILFPDGGRTAPPP